MAEGMDVDPPARPSDEQKDKKRFEVKKVTNLINRVRDTLCGIVCFLPCSHRY